MGIQNFSATGRITQIDYNKTDKNTHLFFILEITEHIKDKSGRNIVSNIPCVLRDQIADNFNKFLTNGDDVDIIGKIRTQDDTTNNLDWHVEVAEFNVHDTLAERLLKNLDYKDIDNFKNVWMMYFKDNALSDDEISLILPYLSNQELDQEDIQSIMAEMLHRKEYQVSNFITLAKELLG